jgi:hypothetical protein
VHLWTTQVRCPQAPQAKQQQKKRTFDVLQNADSFTRYGHTAQTQLKTNTSGDIKRSRLANKRLNVDRHPLASVATLVFGLRCLKGLLTWWRANCTPLSGKGKRPRRWRAYC